MADNTLEKERQERTSLKYTDGPVSLQISLRTDTPDELMSFIRIMEEARKDVQGILDEMAR